MKHLSLISALLLSASSCWAFSPAFWGAVTSGGNLTIVSDSFTVAVDTSLDSHSPEIGGSWTVQTGPVTVKYDSTDGYLLGNANKVVGYNSATADDILSTITGKVTGTASQNIIGAMGRINSSGNGYTAELAGDGKFYIIKRGLNGVYTSTLSGPSAVSGFSTSTIYTVSLLIKGSSITAKLYSGGTLLYTLSATDSSFTTGYCGVFMNSTSAYIYSFKCEKM